jgi:hypothetical protein
MIRRVITELKSAGIPASKLGRLTAEIALLERIGRNLTFPTSLPERREVANAIRDAQEFRTIRRLLGVSKERFFLRDLADAMRGSASRLEQARRPYQFQSQLWIGAIFSAGGLDIRPLQPRNDQVPDYTLNIEGTDYAMEVKRPQTRKSIRGLLIRGREQIRQHGTKGGIVLDVTDCLPEAALFLHGDDPKGRPEARVDAAFEEVYKHAGRLVFDPVLKRHRPNFKHVCFLLVFAQGWRWFRRGPKGPELFLCSQFGLFVTAKGNVTHWDVNKLRDAYLKGLAATDSRVTREGWSNL